MAGQSQELVPVHITGAPVRLWESSRQHMEELTREFALLALGDSSNQHVPARLLSLIADLSREYGAFTETPTAERDQAMAAGERRVDLVYQVPSSAAKHARVLQELMDEADEFCMRGDLLTLATPEPMRAFRNWYLEEFIRQLGGEPPRRWAGPLA